MRYTAVLVLSDTIHVQHWIGPRDALVSHDVDYEQADLPLLPTIRILSARAVGFACYHRWVSYTRGEPYEEVLFYRPRLLRELVKNYGRLVDTLDQSSSWRALRSYEDHEQVSQEQLERLLSMQG